MSRAPERLNRLRALTFDVFGTVVDWRSSVIREGEALARAHGLDLDWAAFADRWRGMYQPAMERVRSGERPWTVLDTLHRESLDVLLDEHGVTGLTEEEIARFNRVWHRLDAWPDSAEGLARFKRRYVVSTLSNGNVALLVEMAKRAGLPWDAVLGAETARAYKPLPQAYLETARMLGAGPGECMMVAAHNDDLVAAAALGFHTAFVCRPTEHGPGQTTNLAAEHDFDLVAQDLVDLADQLDC